MSELKRYLVTGSISSQFEVEVYASSADDARGEAYCKVTETYGEFEDFDVDSIDEE